MNLTTFLNWAWMRSCEGELARFIASSKNVAATQHELLLQMLRQNSDCQYGRRYDFAQLQTADEFRERVPIVTFDDLEPSIAAIIAGEPNVLTAEPVLLLEPTSGSTSGRRLVPYTRALRQQFQRAIAAWIADLFSARPNVRRGRAYWSITPQFEAAARTPGGLRIGFADDTEYLGGPQRFAARQLQVVPPAAIQTSDFRYRTLLHLLAAGDLALVSVWSPTFLTMLLAQLDEWSPHLLRDLPALASRRRTAEVAAILSTRAAASEKLQRLWPKLALISCWADGASAAYVGEVRAMFPGVELQPKGLLSTECFVSFPLCDRPGSTLAIRSHFFEFAAAESTATKLAHELDVGSQYRVIVTTGGGLYRSDTGDRIEVVGRENECPLVRFVGREQTSDMVGEKLSEAFVQQAIARLVAQGPARSFAALVPARGARQYILLLQFSAPPELDVSAAWSESLHRELCQNPYYRSAIELGQLQRASVQIVAAPPRALWEHYEQSCIARGMRAGDIKPRTLDTVTDWSGWIKS